MPGGNYPIIASKLGKRKAAGTESNVFWKGELVPAAKIRKETTRHGYMTTLERLSRAQGNDRIQRRSFCIIRIVANSIVEPESPETPLGVEICTPPAYPVFRRVFEELPILKFLRSEEIKFSKITSRTS